MADKRNRLQILIFSVNVACFQIHRAMAQLASAPALGAGGRGFESHWPDQFRGYRIVAFMTAFQAVETGSIPVTRSIPLRVKLWGIPREISPKADFSIQTALS